MKRHKVNTGKREFLIVALAGLAAALFHWVTYGSQFGDNGSHWKYLPALFSSLDPGLYPGDAYVAALWDLPTFFWEAMARIVAVSGSGPERVFSWLYPAVLWAVYFSMGLLARELTGSARGAIIAVGLALLSPFLHHHGLLSHEALLRPHLDHTLFSLPFWMFALWLWLASGKGRRDIGTPPWAYVLLGVAFNFSPPLSFGLALCMAGADYFSLYRGDAINPYHPAFFLPASLPVWGKVSKVLFAPAAPDWTAAMRLWYPWHYFPSAWPWTQWLYILFHGALLGSLVVIAFKYLRPNHRILRFSGCVVLFWVVTAVLSEALALRWVVSLQGLRLDGVMTFVGLAAGAVALETLLTGGGGRPEIGRASLAGILWCAVAAGSPGVFPAAFIAPAAVFAVSKQGLPCSQGLAVWFAGAVLVCSFLIIMLGSRLQFSNTAVLGAALFSAFYLLAAWGGHLHSAVNAGMAVFLGLTGFLFFAGAAATGIGSRRSHLENLDTIHERKVEDWLRFNTSRDALVLAVPVRRDLRVGARRSIAGQWIDGAAMHWRPGFAGDWKRDMKRFGFILERVPIKNRNEALKHFPVLKDPPPKARNIRMWGDNEVEKLLRSYRPDWVVSVYSLPSKKLKMAFRSGRFAVFKVKKYNPLENAGRFSSPGSPLHAIEE